MLAARPAPVGRETTGRAAERSQDPGRATSRRGGSGLRFSIRRHQPGQSVPRPGSRRRHADAPAAARLNRSGGRRMATGPGRVQGPQRPPRARRLLCPSFLRPSPELGIAGQPSRPAQSMLTLCGLDRGSPSGGLPWPRSSWVSFPSPQCTRPATSMSRDIHAGPLLPRVQPPSVLLPCHGRACPSWSARYGSAAGTRRLWGCGHTLRRAPLKLEAQGPPAGCRFRREVSSDPRRHAGQARSPKRGAGSGVPIPATIAGKRPLRLRRKPTPGMVPLCPRSGPHQGSWTGKNPR